MRLANSLARWAPLLLLAVCAAAAQAQSRLGAPPPSSAAAPSLAAARAAPGQFSGAPVIDAEGRLEAGDATLETGEYFDAYEFTGAPGERVAISLSSRDFDTYLMLVHPNRIQEDNDDAGESTHRSVLRTRLTEPGTYRVIVTSYEPGMQGDYRLSVSRSVADVPLAEDAVTLEAGKPFRGRLDRDDPRDLDGTRFQDSYVFHATAGQVIELRLASSEFDPYLVLVTPAGEHYENDDHEDSTSRSRLELTALESGPYHVFVTSYHTEATGRYELTADVSGPGRLLGVFVGISDYPGDDMDLLYTARDARVAHAAMARAGMDPADGFVLTDAEATVGNLRRTLRDVASTAGPDDTVVFFFSGHGERRRRPDGPQFPTDPDGFDETLVLYDGDITDDELASLFQDVHAGTTLFVVDACYSGGFAKDLISMPGRMGLFSSEEDILSAVAGKFQAGGYLSAFFSEAVGDARADYDLNGGITAHELSEYIHERYRAEIRRKRADSSVRLTDFGHQRLVVDRGGVRQDRVLFRVK